MPNLNFILKQEIVRLARSELRSHTTSLKKASASYRRDIAALKREAVASKRRIQMLERSISKTVASQSQAVSETPIRFVAKGLLSMRQRLGLSAAGLAKLIGVSEQSVYNWEQKKTTPRREQVHALAALRGIGKREAQARLEKLAE